MRSNHIDGKREKRRSKKDQSSGMKGTGEEPKSHGGRGRYLPKKEKKGGGIKWKKYAAPDYLL